MMKILFIITQSEIGGAQRYLLEFAPYLASKGHDVMIAAGKGDGELFKKLQINSKTQNPKTYYIKNLVRSLNPVKDLLALTSLLKIIKKERPNILFLQSTKAGFLGSLASKLYQIPNTKCQIPVIYRIGGWSFNDPRSWWMNKILFWMEKISARWKDIIIVNSEFDRKVAVDKKIASEKKIVKIYNGINPDSIKLLPKRNAGHAILDVIPAKAGIQSKHHMAFALDSPSPMPLEDKFRENDKEFLIGTIANLYATKGIEYLIGAARLLNISGFRFQVSFVIIGEGRERPKLEQLIKQYNLENSFFLVGRIPNAYKYLEAFDIFVLPSLKEGFPWAILEAMAAEIPIIATNVGAVPEILENEEEGLLVEPGGSESLANAIKKIAENPALGQSLAKNARVKLKKFSRDKMLEQSEAVILSFIQKYPQILS